MRHILAALVALALWADGRAITIQLDYSYAEGFFDKNPTANAALIQAANDLSDALSARLATLNAVDRDKFVGSNGFLTATFDWDLKIPNPSSPNPDPDPSIDNRITIADFSFAPDVFKVYAGGAESLQGLEALGEAAPASADFQLQADSGGPASMVAAILSAVDYSNGVLLRGAGPTIASIETIEELIPGEKTNYTLHLGALASFLSFDIHADWHFDHTTPVEDGKFDFYTVMLHEMIHGLGFGSSETWRSKVEGANWSGQHVGELKGSGNGLINQVLNGHPDGGHVAADTMSKTIEGNIDQEAVMTATLQPGQRRKLTHLDIAFLLDIGYGLAAAAPTPPATPVPATPIPSPTPVAAEAPAVPTILGKVAKTTTKSKIKLKGRLSSPGAYVQYRIGKGAFVKAKGGAAWKIALKLQPGKNIITMVSFDPATGKMSAPKKIVIKKL